MRGVYSRGSRDRRWVLSHVPRISHTVLHDLHCDAVCAEVNGTAGTAQFRDHF